MSARFNDNPKQENRMGKQQSFKHLDNAEIAHHLEKKDATITLLENGMILNCNEAAASLLGCNSSNLTWQPISKLLPQLANLALVLDEKLNPYLKFLSMVGHRFEVRAMNGTHFACELFLARWKNLAGTACI